MDQEGTGRRRSSRLAAKGIVTTPKVETIVKKSVKSSEKPKRSKRKTTEETIELPEAKKTKTEDKTSSDEIDNPEKNKTNNVDENDVSGISPMDVDNVEETNVSASDVEKKELPTVEEKTDVPLEDSKDQEVVEKLPVANDEKEKEKSVETEDKKSEITEEPIKVKDPEIIEQPKNDSFKDEPRQEPPVALENTNGKSDEKEKIEPVEETVNNDIGFCVATKDVVTPNGDTEELVKATNGDDPITVVEEIEPIKVLHVETDLKAVTATTAIATKNDEPVNEQVEKELDKAVGNVVDNNINASADDNAPKVDQLSTVVS
ncbi:hypothetical protein ACI65C_004051 [Semiaphis heraclei]